MKRLLVLFGMAYGLFSCQSDSQSVHKEDKQRQDSLRIAVLDSAIYLQKGNQIVKATFDTLSSTLKNAIAKQGIEGALRHCNVAALPITNLYAGENGVTIRRTSLKYRNESNKPDVLETNVLGSYESEKSSNQPLKEKIVVDDMGVHFFKPIITQALCLNCHGQIGKSLATQNNASIAKLYPNDKAIGYQLNELRGTWHITFKKNKKLN